MDTIKAIRGMNDILPADTGQWQAVEAAFQELMSQYGYAEVRLPIVEKTALFKRSIGEVTDIVEKEMYTFADRNDESLTLRPEGTAGCVRSLIESGNANGQSQHRLWYTGPMFRYERPQKGRQRQFHQLGVETFGIADAEMDAELLLLTRRFWQKLGLQDVVKLELNSIGTTAERAAYKEALVDYLGAKATELDEDSQRRLHTNPLRILDSKDQNTQRLLDDAPKLEDFLGETTKSHFDRVCSILDTAGVAYTLNPRLVRGLDYYNYTVFEWTTELLGAQATVCAGGRYDNLVEQLGGKATPAVGFAMGVERLVLLLQEVSADSAASSCDVYIVSAGAQAMKLGLIVAEQVRDIQPQLKVVCNTATAGFKSQMKKVDKSGAVLAIIIGDDEAEQDQVAVKWLRDRSKEQTTIARADLGDIIKELDVN